MIRRFGTMAVGIALRALSYRFSKDWRHAETGGRAWIYQHLCCTFLANRIADGAPIRSGWWA